MLPFLIPSVMGAVGRATKGKLSFGLGAKKRRRRSKRRLTSGELQELAQIKAVLGRTAAANALPFYMGRGR